MHVDNIAEIAGTDQRYSENAAPQWSGEPLRQAVPLVVDLDGTLIFTDLLHESAFKLALQSPLDALAMPMWLAAGKAALKARIAQRVELDVDKLPCNEAVLALIRDARAQGRWVVLCTASDQKYAQALAQHLGLFDEVIASDGATNVSAQHKARVLVERFGEKGFDYAGNSVDDLPVWACARRAIVVNAPGPVARQARERFDVAAQLPGPQAGLRALLKALRLHQWMKNLLVFVPLAAAFQLANSSLAGQALLAFLAFGLCASSVYVLNDLTDLDNDRAHPRKCRRPFAAGLLSIPLGLLLGVGCLTAAAGLASMLPAQFGWSLLGYFCLTLAYTFFLKSRVIVDCLSLGMLYTARIVAGGCAVGIKPSFWLLAFSLFLFLSLAFVKRYSELQVMAALGRNSAKGRGYLASDLPLVMAMGVAAGFAAVTLLALYINGEAALRLYAHPEVLWATVPVMLYWVSRMWMQAQRGRMHDDPMVFAVRDRYSVLCALLFGLTLVLAR